MATEGLHGAGKEWEENLKPMQNRRPNKDITHM